jgi:hypothetical protein
MVARNESGSVSMVKSVSIGLGHALLEGIADIIHVVREPAHYFAVGARVEKFQRQPRYPVVSVAPQGIHYFLRDHRERALGDVREQGVQ